MKLEFKETKPMTQCFIEALQHIKNAKDRGSRAVVNLNPSAFRNRIVSYAVLFYIRSNWKKTDMIECEYRSKHYGKAIGTVMEKTVDIGDIKTSVYTNLLKQARKISLNTEPTAYS